MAKWYSCFFGGGGGFPLRRVFAGVLFGQGFVHVCVVINLVLMLVVEKTEDDESFYRVGRVGDFPTEFVLELRFCLSIHLPIKSMSLSLFLFLCFAF